MSWCWEVYLSSVWLLGCRRSSWLHCVFCCIDPFSPQTRITFPLSNPGWTAWGSHCCCCCSPPNVSDREGRSNQVVVYCPFVNLLSIRERTEGDSAAAAAALWLSGSLAAILCASVCWWNRAASHLTLKRRADEHRARFCLWFLTTAVFELWQRTVRTVLLCCRPVTVGTVQ